MLRHTVLCCMDHGHLCVLLQFMMAGGMYYRSAGKGHIPLGTTWGDGGADGSWALQEGRDGPNGEVAARLCWWECELPAGAAAAAAGTGGGSCDVEG